MEEKKKECHDWKCGQTGIKLLPNIFFTDHSYHKSHKIFMLNNSIDNIKKKSESHGKIIFTGHTFYLFVHKLLIGPKYSSA